VITAHQGGLRLINRPGDGATFEVLLPEVASVERVAVPEPAKVAGGQDQCIAVVDDETIVAEICRKLLLKFNYRPLVFKNAAELLQHVGLAGAEQPALIITDQTMPQLTGIEMIRILRQRGIATPIILMSGYTHGVSPDEAKLIERVAFVPKPFEHAHLLEVVQQMLQMR
jgi:FixJ family two-component response regulator